MVTSTDLIEYNMLNTPVVQRVRLADGKPLLSNAEYKALMRPRKRMKFEVMYMLFLCIPTLYTYTCTYLQAAANQQIVQPTAAANRNGHENVVELPQQPMISQHEWRVMLGWNATFNIRIQKYRMRIPRYLYIFNK